MEFSVFTNDTNEKPYMLAPGEVLLLSNYGQLLVANDMDKSISAVPKQGKYVIVFETNNDAFETSVRVVY